MNPRDRKPEVNPLECPRCACERSIEIKLKGRRSGSPVAYMGAPIRPPATDVLLNGRECLVCGEQWYENQRVNVPIDPNDPEWKDIFISLCADGMTSATDIIERTDARWVAFRVRKSRYQEYLKDPIKQEPKEPHEQ